MTTDEAVTRLETCANQTHAAIIYARALRDPFGIKWVALDRAILTRWSMSGLKRVKAQAWKLATADGPLPEPKGLHLN